LRRYSFAKKLQSRKKLYKSLSYKKAGHKMLVKLTPGVDFTNILPAAFTNADPKSAIETKDLISSLIALL